MSKGILYVMTTVVDGLIKIGRTGSNSFEQRMYNLERNGYCNVGGLHRKFAIEVEDYEDKEALLDNIFSKSQLPGTELFALDINLVTQLLASFDGKVIYPKQESKDAIFDEATSKVSKANPKNKKKEPRVMLGEEEAEPKKKPRKSASRFRFSLVGIPIGSELTYIHDSSVKVIVEDDAHVKYDGEVWALSPLAQKLENKAPLQGTLYFSYEGETLVERRQRMLGDSNAKKFQKKVSKDG